MSELSINVIIAGRTYPLNIEQGEEEGVRAAANKINEAIKVLQENYAVKDTQDLLAMAALQLVVQSGFGAAPSPSAQGQEHAQLTGLLHQLNHTLENALK
jgi:cell division protein ZapA